jgi:antibiotic biosynthesis monooxygenase (ABM) superfamily enzyme
MQHTQHNLLYHYCIYIIIAAYTTFLVHRLTGMPSRTQYLIAAAVIDSMNAQYAVMPRSLKLISSVAFTRHLSGPI